MQVVVASVFASTSLGQCGRVLKFFLPCSYVIRIQVSLVVNAEQTEVTDISIEVSGLLLARYGPTCESTRDAGTK